MMDRRNFIKNATGAGAALYLSNPVFGHPSSLIFNSSRLFKISLNPFSIGATLNQKDLLKAAVDNGFEAILPIPTELAEMSSDQKTEFLGQMKKDKITWDAAGLPVDFRKGDELFNQGLADLPRLAKALKDCGVSRMSTWIMPTDQELTYLENFDRHASRLKKITEVISDYGLKLGLEYVGPKTLTSLHKYPFISSMKEAFELIDKIGVKNLGIQLDSFHWYCAEETVADIESLTNDQIVTCDLNDATAGRSVAEQIDGERELPGDSGVIDLSAFLQALVKIGYNGPVRAEPFNAKLNNMENMDAIKATSKAMHSTINKI